MTSQVFKTGMLTADFGAISFINHGSILAQGNVVRGNCVRDVRGMRDQMFTGNPAGLLLSFWGRALYLDDHASNMQVSHNVFADTSHAAIFFHSGSNNTVWNNVFVNSTMNKGSTPSDQLLFKETLRNGKRSTMKDNRLYRNVIWTPRPSEEPAPGDVPLLGGSSAGARSVSLGGGTHHNWYFRRGKGIAYHKVLWFANDWKEWTTADKMGRGNGSSLNVDPKFVDAEGGNWNLATGSPLKEAIGWEDLHMPMC